MKRLAHHSWFLESFDTVRDHHQRQDLAERRLHARSELLLNMLFGCQMAVPRPVSFDSRIFAQTAFQVLTTRPPNISDRVRDTCPVYRPFVWGRQQKFGTDLASAYAMGLRDTGLILSSLPTIGCHREEALTGRNEADANAELLEQAAIRTRMAEAVAKGDWSAAAGQLGYRASNSDAYFLAEQLPRLHEEFNLPGCFRDTVVPAQSLPNYLADYRKLGPEQAALIDTFFACAQTAGASPAQLNNRSWVRSYRAALLAAGLTSEQHAVIVELFDNIYSDIVAASNQTAGRFNSSGGDIANRWIREVEQYDAQRMRDLGMGTSRLALQLQVTDGFAAITRQSGWGEEAYDRQWKKHWEALWENVFTNPDWIDSACEFHTADYVSPTPGWEKESLHHLQKQVDKHVRLLAKLTQGLPLTFHATNGGMKLDYILPDVVTDATKDVAKDTVKDAIKEIAVQTGLAASAGAIIGLECLAPYVGKMEGVVMAAATGAAAMAGLKRGVKAFRQYRNEGVMAKALKNAARFS